MNNDENQPIMKCPECNAEIDRLYYSVDSYENGTCDISVDSSHPRTNGDPRINTDSFDSDNSEWSGNPTFTCHECDSEILLSEIIIEPAEQKEKKEIIPEKEPDDAVDSITHIIIKEKKDKNPNPYDMDRMGICTCPECHFVFCVNPEAKYSSMNDEEVAFCPKCGAELEVVKNVDATRKLAIKL